MGPDSVRVMDGCDGEGTVGVIWTLGMDLGTEVSNWGTEGLTVGALGATSMVSLAVGTGFEVEPPVAPGTPALILR
jgi:hypothetical protein